MEVLHSIPLGRLRNDEYEMFLTEVKKLIEADTPEKLGLQLLFPIYTGALTVVNAINQAILGSSITVLLNSADDIRGRFTWGFTLQVESYTYHYDPATVEAATRVYRVLNQYGDVRHLPFNEESSSMTNLYQELMTNYAADLETMRLTAWVDKVVESNEQFKTLFNDRANEQASKKIGNMRTARVDSDKAYRDIVKRISALSEVNGLEAYASFIDRHNYYVDYYKNAIATRKGRNGGNKPDGDETK